MRGVGKKFGLYTSQTPKETLPYLTCVGVQHGSTMGHRSSGSTKHIQIQQRHVVFTDGD